ncbi:hypothetical protein COO60DRAFT_1541167 [Scenedesmus sp. NREL 46B-D3]|nr:hypothetical protein COO60DRAFT_1541167 [Scenedesmus sp. NREL 46B-D3]
MPVSSVQRPLISLQQELVLRSTLVSSQSCSSIADVAISICWHRCAHARPDKPAELTRATHCNQPYVQLPVRQLLAGAFSNLCFSVIHTLPALSRVRQASQMNKEPSPTTAQPTLHCPAKQQWHGTRQRTRSIHSRNTCTCTSNVCRPGPARCATGISHTQQLAACTSHRKPELHCNLSHSSCAAKCLDVRLKACNCCSCTQLELLYAYHTQPSPAEQTCKAHNMQFKQRENSAVKNSSDHQTCAAEPRQQLQQHLQENLVQPRASNACMHARQQQQKDNRCSSMVYGT